MDIPSFKYYIKSEWIKMFYLKVHEVPGELLVAVCDREILGRKYSQGRLRLEVHEGFYKGSLSGEEEVISALNRASIANLVGNRVVEKAVEHCLISPENVVEIGGVKHAQLVSIPRQKR